jgi:protein-disulfide isomerase
MFYAFYLGAALLLSATLIEGDPKAPVRIIVYEDLACGDCHNFREMLDRKILPKYGARVAVEHRDFPLTKHPWARPAALAARHFEKENPKLALEFRRVTLAQRKSITVETLPQHVAQFARQFGSDPIQAVEALKSASLNTLVENDFQEGLARGVVKTPSVFVDGEPFIEIFTFDEIASGIDAALKAVAK